MCMFKVTIKEIKANTQYIFLIEESVFKSVLTEKFSIDKRTLCKSASLKLSSSEQQN